jgi:hypothetical protein
MILLPPSWSRWLRSPPRACSTAYGMRSDSNRRELGVVRDHSGSAHARGLPVPSSAAAVRGRYGKRKTLVRRSLVKASAQTCIAQGHAARRRRTCSRPALATSRPSSMRRARSDRAVSYCARAPCACPMTNPRRSRAVPSG